MSNYTKSTNFATKDNLTPGDPLKVVRGTEIDTEYNNIATAIATKTDNASAAITGGTITGITDLAVADGGTGASTAAGALNNLLPSQTSNANKYLQTDGTNATWDAVSLSTADITGTLAVANGGTGVTTSTGTTNVVLSNSPTLVTPALGTPSSAVLTNATGLPISTGVSGLGTGVATFLATPSSANLISAVTDETGTGSLVFATSPTLVTPALGTPSALVGTNITGTASGLTAGNVTTNANLTGAVTSVGNATSLGSFTSAQLATALTDETGSGANVFATSPTLVTPTLGVATATSLQGIIGNVTPAAGAFTTVDASGAVTLAGGTANGVTFLNGSKVLTSGSALTFDGSNLGVGMTATAIAANYATLQLGGSVGGGIKLGTSSASAGYLAGTAGGIEIGTTGATSLSLFTNNATRAILDTSGNLGLGVTPTGKSKFEVYTGFGSFNGVQVQLNSGNTPIVFACDNSNGDGYLGSNTVQSTGTNQTYAINNFANKLRMNSGSFLFYTAPSGTAGNAITFTQAMTLDANSNLTLGQTTSTARLTVQSGVANGTVAQFGGSSGGSDPRGLTIKTFSSNGGGDCGVDFNAAINNTSYGSFKFSAGSATLATIDSSGNLLVGVTSASSGSSNTIFNGSNSTWTLRVQSGGSSAPNGLLLKYSAASPNSTGDQFLYCEDSGNTQRMSVRSNGGIANYSANNVNLSDRREKTNFAPATSYLDKICAIPVQTFNYIDQNMEEDGGLTLGVVAQDVQAIAPELVMESNWAGKDAEPKMRLSIYQTDLQYALMKCIQEQQALIQSLKARLDAANL